jgi:hypothetical protein
MNIENWPNFRLQFSIEECKKKKEKRKLKECEKGI